jgi:hypothetical protein
MNLELSISLATLESIINKISSYGDFIFKENFQKFFVTVVYFKEPIFEIWLSIFDSHFIRVTETISLT